MIKKATYRFTDICPYTDTRQSIQISYFKIPVMGTLTQGYKKDSYSCPLHNECPFPERDEYGRCPVYLNAPASPC